MNERLIVKLSMNFIRLYMDSHPSLKMLRTDGSEQHMQAQIGEHAP